MRGEPPDEVMMWKRNKEWSPEEVLSRQLAMNERTWAELQAHGVTEETQLRRKTSSMLAVRERAPRLRETAL